MGQPKKDSNSQRVNYDNTRESKFEKDVEKGESGKDSKPQSASTGKSGRRHRGRGGKSGASPESKSMSGARYARNPGLLGAASSYSFAFTTGQKLPFQYKGSSSDDPNPQTVPGIMTLGWEPAFGGDNIAALQQALDSIYSFVVHANSRNMDKYNAMDQGCFIIAGCQFFAYLESLKRVYGYMRWINERNEYAPKYLIEALGFDYADLQKNLSNMWFDINYLVTLSRQIWIPNVMPVLFRWMEMNSVVYTDGNSPKSQMYVYVPARLLMVDETISATGTCLRPVVYSGDPSVGGSLTDCVDFTHNPSNQVASAPYTWSAAIGIAQTMLNALINSDSRGLIYGDILKAYGSEGIYAASEIDASYLLAPVYSEDALVRIENATIVPQMAFAMVQNQVWSKLEPAYIRFGKPDKFETALYPHNVILNMHKEDVSPAEILFATEHTVAGCTHHLVKPLTIVADSEQPSGFKFEPAQAEERFSTASSSGTEVITSFSICTKQFEVRGLSAFRRYDNKMSNFLTHPIALASYMSFDWAPWLYYANADDPTGGDEWMPGLAAGDFDNYMVMTPVDMLKIHTAVVYDAMGIPVSMR